ncbi:MAG: hypothetical protein AAGD13_10410 [Pseudomonadota bacterium]
MTDDLALVETARRSRFRAFQRVRLWIVAHPLTMRWILAGPIALILSIVTMAAMPFWFPEGAAGVDHLAMPVVIFPLIWTVALMYPCIEDNMPRATLIMLAALFAQLLVIIAAF